MKVNPFLELDATRKKTLAGIDVETAEMAVRDSEDSSRRAASALAGGGKRDVGGGTFSRLRGRRGVSLGGIMTGGLAAANRQALAKTKKDAAQESYSADFEAMARSRYSSLGSGAYRNSLRGRGGASGDRTLTDSGRLSPNSLMGRRGDVAAGA